MVLPCAILCLLALSLDFKPSPDIQKCSYCAQMRALSLSCEQKPWDCADWDPDSLIYCLSRDERPWGRDSLKRSTRCISHANLLNQSSILLTRDALDTLRLIPASGDGQQCTFEAAQQCQCPDCILPQEEEPPANLATELQNVALLLDELIVEEQRQQKGNTMVTRKNTRRTLPPRLVVASAPLRPLPKNPKGGASVGIIPLPADFLHSGAPSSRLALLPSIFHHWPIHFFAPLFIVIFIQFL